MIYAKIIFIRRNGTDGAYYPLTSRTCLFGRHEECDIPIQLRQVADNHCQINVNEDGEILLTNLTGNSFSVSLNGSPLSKTARLRHGDVFCIRERSFRFEVLDPLQKNPSNTNRVSGTELAGANGQINTSDGNHSNEGAPHPMVLENTKHRNIAGETQGNSVNGTDGNDVETGSSTAILQRLNSSGLQMFHLRRIGPAATKPGVADVMDFWKVTSMIGRKATQIDFLIDSSDYVQGAYVSRLHARMVRRQKNIHRLFDDSLNGVYVNNFKIAGHVDMQEGDRVTFGHPQGSNLTAGIRVHQPDSEYQFMFEVCSCPLDSRPPQHLKHNVAGISSSFKVPSEVWVPRAKTTRQCRNATPTLTQEDIIATCQSPDAGTSLKVEMNEDISDQRQNSVFEHADKMQTESVKKDDSLETGHDDGSNEGQLTGYPGSRKEVDAVHCSGERMDEGEVEQNEVSFQANLGHQQEEAGSETGPSGSGLGSNGGQQADHTGSITGVATLNGNCVGVIEQETVPNGNFLNQINPGISKQEEFIMEDLSETGLEAESYGGQQADNTGSKTELCASDVNEETVDEEEVVQNEVPRDQQNLGKDDVEEAQAKNLFDLNDIAIEQHQDKLISSEQWEPQQSADVVDKNVNVEQICKCTEKSVTEIEKKESNDITTDVSMLEADLDEFNEIAMKVKTELLAVSSQGEETSDADLGDDETNNAQDQIYFVDSQVENIQSISLHPNVDSSESIGIIAAGESGDINTEVIDKVEVAPKSIIRWGVSDTESGVANEQQAAPSVTRTCTLHENDRDAYSLHLGHEIGLSKEMDMEVSGPVIQCTKDVNSLDNKDSREEKVFETESVILVEKMSIKDSRQPNVDEKGKGSTHNGVVKKEICNTESATIVPATSVPATSVPAISFFTSDNRMICMRKPTSEDSIEVAVPSVDDKYTDLSGLSDCIKLDKENGNLDDNLERPLLLKKDIRNIHLKHIEQSNEVERLPEVVRSTEKDIFVSGHATDKTLHKSTFSVDATGDEAFNHKHHSSVTKEAMEMECVQIDANADEELREEGTYNQSSVNAESFDVKFTSDVCHTFDSTSKNEINDRDASTNNPLERSVESGVSDDYTELSGQRINGEVDQKQPKLKVSSGEGISLNLQNETGYQPSHPSEQRALIQETSLQELNNATTQQNTESIDLKANVDGLMNNVLKSVENAEMNNNSSCQMDSDGVQEGVDSTEEEVFLAKFENSDNVKLTSKSRKAQKRQMSGVYEGVDESVDVYPTDLPLEKMLLCVENNNSTKCCHQDSFLEEKSNMLMDHKEMQSASEDEGTDGIAVSHNHDIVDNSGLIKDIIYSQQQAVSVDAVEMYQKVAFHEKESDREISDLGEQLNREVASSEKGSDKNDVVDEDVLFCEKECVKAGSNPEDIRDQIVASFKMDFATDVSELEDDRAIATSKEEICNDIASFSKKSKEKSSTCKELVHIQMASPQKRSENERPGHEDKMEEENASFDRKSPVVIAPEEEMSKMIASLDKHLTEAISDSEEDYTEIFSVETKSDSVTTNPTEQMEQLDAGNEKEDAKEMSFPEQANGKEVFLRKKERVEVILNPEKEIVKEVTSFRNDFAEQTSSPGEENKQKIAFSEKEITEESRHHGTNDSRVVSFCKDCAEVMSDLEEKLHQKDAFYERESDKEKEREDSLEEDINKVVSLGNCSATEKSNHGESNKVVTLFEKESTKSPSPREKNIKEITSFKMESAQRKCMNEDRKEKSSDAGHLNDKNPDADKMCSDSLSYEKADEIYTAVCQDEARTSQPFSQLETKHKMEISKDDHVFFDKSNTGDDREDTFQHGCLQDLFENSSQWNVSRVGYTDIVHGIASADLKSIENVESASKSGRKRKLSEILQENDDSNEVNGHCLKGLPLKKISLPTENEHSRKSCSKDVVIKDESEVFMDCREMESVLEHKTVETEVCVKNDMVDDYGCAISSIQNTDSTEQQFLPENCREIKNNHTKKYFSGEDQSIVPIDCGGKTSELEDNGTHDTGTACIKDIVEDSGSSMIFTSKTESSEQQCLTENDMETEEEFAYGNNVSSKEISYTENHGRVQDCTCNVAMNDGDCVVEPRTDELRILSSIGEVQIIDLDGLSNKEFNEGTVTIISDEDDKDAESSEPASDKDSESSELNSNKDAESSKLVMDKAVDSSEFVMDKDTESSELVIDKDAESSELVMDKDTESTEPTMDKDVESSELVMDKDAESSELVMDKDAESSELVLEKVVESSELVMDKDVESSEPSMDKDVESSDLVKDKDRKSSQLDSVKGGKPSELVMDKDFESSELVMDKDVESSELVMDKAVESSEYVMDKDVKSSELVWDKAVESSELFMDKDAESSELVMDKDAESSELVMDKDVESSELVMDKDAESSELVKDKDAESSEIVMDKDAESSEIAMDKDAESSEIVMDKDVESSELVLEKAVESSEPVMDKDPESSELVMDKDAELSEIVMDKDAESSEIVMDKAVESSELGIYKDAESSEPAMDKDVESSDLVMDKDCKSSEFNSVKGGKPSELVKDKDAESSESAMDKAVESSELVMDKDAESSELVMDKDAESSELVMDKDAESSEPAMDKDVESSELVLEKAVESSEYVMDKDVKSSELVWDKTVESSELVMDKDAESSELVMDKDVESSELVMDKDAESSELVMDKDAESSESAMDKAVESSDLVMDKDAESSELVMDKAVESSELFMDKDAESSEPVMDKDVESSELVIDKDTESSEPAMDKDVESSELVMDKAVESSELVMDKDAESSEHVMDKDAESSELVMDKDAESSEPAMDKDVESSELVMDTDSESSELVMDKAVESSELFMDKDAESSEPVMDKDVESSELVIDKDTESSEPAMDKDVESSELVMDKAVESSELVMDKDAESSEHVMDKDAESSELVMDKDAESSEPAMDKDVESSELVMDTDSESSELVMDKAVESSELVMDKDAESSEPAMDKDVESSDLVMDKDRKSSELNSVNGGKPSELVKDKDAESSESAMDKAVESSELVMDKDAESSELVMDKDAESSEPAMDKDVESSELVLEKAVESSEHVLDKDVESSELVWDKAVELSELFMDKDAESSELVMDKDVESSELVMDKDAESSELVMDKDAESSEIVMDKDVESSDLVVDKDAESSELVMDKAVESSELFMDKDVESSEPVMDKYVESSGLVIDKDTESSEPAMDKDVESSELVMDKAVESSELVMDKDAESSEHVMDKDAESSELVMDKDAESSEPAMDKDVESSELVMDTDSESSELVMDKAVESSELVMDKDAESSEPAMDKDVESSDLVMDKDRKSSELNSVNGGKPSELVKDKDAESSESAMDKAVESSELVMDKDAESSELVMDKDAESSEPAMDKDVESSELVLEKAVESSEHVLDKDVESSELVWDKAVELSELFMDKDAESSELVMDKDVESSELVMDKDAESSELVMDKDAESSEIVMDKDVESSDLVVDKDAESSELVMDKAVESSELFMDKDVESSEPVMDKYVESSGLVIDKDTESSEPAMDKDVESSELVMDKAVESSELVMDKNAESSELVMDKDAESSEPAMDKDVESSELVMDTDSESSELVMDKDAESSELVMDKAVESSELVMDKAVESSELVMDKDAESSELVMDKDAESSELVMDKDAESSEPAMDKDVESSDLVMDKDRKSSEFNSVKGGKPSELVKDKDAESSESAMDKAVESSELVMDKDAESSELVMDKDAESSEPAMDKDVESSELVLEKAVESSEHVLDKDVESSELVWDKAVELSELFMDKDAESSELVMDKDVESSELVMDKDAESSELVMDKDAESSEIVMDKDVESSDLVIDKDAESSELVMDKAVESSELFMDKDVESSEPVMDKDVESSELVIDKDAESSELVLEKAVESSELVLEKAVESSELVLEKAVESSELVLEKAVESSELVMDKAVESSELVSDKAVESSELASDKGAELSDLVRGKNSVSSEYGNSGSEDEEDLDMKRSCRKDKNSESLYYLLDEETTSNIKPCDQSEGSNQMNDCLHTELTMQPDLDADNEKACKKRGCREEITRNVDEVFLVQSDIRDKQGAIMQSDIRDKQGEIMQSDIRDKQGEIMQSDIRDKQGEIMQLTDKSRLLNVKKMWQLSETGKKSETKSKEFVPCVEGQGEDLKPCSSPESEPLVSLGSDDWDANSDVALDTTENDTDSTLNDSTIKSLPFLSAQVSNENGVSINQVKETPKCFAWPSPNHLDDVSRQLAMSPVIPQQTSIISKSLTADQDERLFSDHSDDDDNGISSLEISALVDELQKTPIVDEAESLLEKTHRFSGNVVSSPLKCQKEGISRSPRSDDSDHFNLDFSDVVDDVTCDDDDDDDDERPVVERYRDGIGDNVSNVNQSNEESVEDDGYVNENEEEHSSGNYSGNIQYLDMEDNENVDENFNGIINNEDNNIDNVDEEEGHGIMLTRRKRGSSLVKRKIKNTVNEYESSHKKVRQSLMRPLDSPIAGQKSEYIYQRHNQLDSSYQDQSEFISTQAVLSSQAVRSPSKFTSVKRQLEYKVQGKSRYQTVMEKLNRLKPTKDSKEEAKASSSLASSSSSQETPSEMSLNNSQHDHFPSGGDPENVTTLVTRCKSIMEKMRQVLNLKMDVLPTHRVQALNEELGKAEKWSELPQTVIAMVGNTGDGKSSLMNAMLGHSSILPTSGIRACTAVVVEVVQNNGSMYEGCIEFLTKEEWYSELERLIEDLTLSNGNLRKKPPDPGSDQYVSYCKVKAVYGKIDKYEVLARINKVTSHLGQKKIVKHKKAREFRLAVERFIETQEPQSGGQFWPIVKHVQLRLPNCDVCRTGAALIDLPGVRDSNAARDKIAKDYLKNCSAIWVVSAMHRAIDDKTAQDLLSENLRRQILMDGHYGSVAFICTKSDQFEISETIRTLKLEGKCGEHKQKINLMEREKQRLLEEIKICKVKKRDLNADIKTSIKECEKLQLLVQEIEAELMDSDLEQPVDHESMEEAKVMLKEKEKEREKNKEAMEEITQDIQKYERQIQDLETQIRQRRRKISHICASARNDYCREKIKQKFQSGLKEIKRQANKLPDEDEDEVEDEDEDAEEVSRMVSNLRVFCCSSTEYQKMKDLVPTDGEAIVFNSQEETEIPHLQEYVHEIIRVRHERYLERLIRGLGHCIFNFQSYILDGGTECGDTRTRVKLVIEKNLQDFNSMIQTVLDKLAEDLDNTFNDMIQPKFHEGVGQAAQEATGIYQKWGSEQSTDHANRRAGGLHWVTYKATIQRLGVFSSKTFGNIDFNEELSEPFNRSITVVWNKVFSLILWRILETVQAGVLEKIQHLNGNVSSELQKMGVHANRIDHVKEQLESNVNYKLTEMVSHLKPLVTAKQRDINRILSPHVQSRLVEAYISASSQTGTGCFARMKQEMESGIDGRRMYIFDDGSQKMMHELLNLKTEMVNAVSAVCDMLQEEIKLAYEPLWEAPSQSVLLQDTFQQDMEEVCEEMRKIYRDAGLQNTEEQAQSQKKPLPTQCPPKRPQERKSVCDIVHMWITQVPEELTKMTDLEVLKVERGSNMFPAKAVKQKPGLSSDSGMHNPSDVAGSSGMDGTRVKMEVLSGSSDSLNQHNSEHPVPPSPTAGPSSYLTNPTFSSMAGQSDVYDFGEASMTNNSQHGQTHTKVKARAKQTQNSKASKNVPPEVRIALENHMVKWSTETSSKHEHAAVSAVVKQKIGNSSTATTLKQEAQNSSRGSIPGTSTAQVKFSKEPLQVNQKGTSSLDARISLLDIRRTSSTSLVGDSASREVETISDKIGTTSAGKMGTVSSRIFKSSSSGNSTGKTMSPLADNTGSTSADRTLTSSAGQTGTSSADKKTGPSSTGKTGTSSADKTGTSSAGKTETSASSNRTSLASNTRTSSASNNRPLSASNTGFFPAGKVSITSTEITRTSSSSTMGTSSSGQAGTSLIGKKGTTSRGTEGNSYDVKGNPSSGVKRTFTSQKTGIAASVSEDNDILPEISFVKRRKITPDKNLQDNPTFGHGTGKVSQGKCTEMSQMIKREPREVDILSRQQQSTQCKTNYNAIIDLTGSDDE